MASASRERLRNAYQDTNSAVARLVSSLFVACVSTVIFGGVDDHLLLTGGKVSTPFIGQTRYEIFMVLAPVSIVILRIYIDMQISYFHRIQQLAKQFRVSRPITLSALNNKALLIAGVLAIHVVPPASIAYLGRHVSAIYPIYGLALYAVACLLVVWSIAFYMTFSNKRAVLTDVAAAAVVVGFCLYAVSSLVAEEGVFGGLSNCEQRYDGPGAIETAPFLRSIDLERRDLSGIAANNMNLICGFLEYSDWTSADLRESWLWHADLNGAKLNDADIRRTDFRFAALRSAEMASANGGQAEFQRAEMSDATFDGADLASANFNGAELDDTSFIGATLDFATFTNGKGVTIDFIDADMRFVRLFDVDFTEVNFAGADLYKAEFYGAKLEDARFAGADLSCASFAAARLKDIDFSGVAPGVLRLIEFKPAEAEDITWPEGFAPRDAGADYEVGDTC